MVLARVAPRFAHRATTRISVRPGSPPFHFDAHNLLSLALPASLRRRRRLPTLSPHDSPTSRWQLMEHSSEEEEEYEGEDEANDPQEAEQGDDDPQEAEQGEEDTEEEVADDDDDLLAPLAHAEEPGSPIHTLEPVLPDHLPLFELPPGSHAESDESSEVSAEQAELGETCRIWTRLSAHGEKISQMAYRLEMVIG